MKKLILAMLCAVAVTMLFASPAQAYYDCGTGWTLYTAPSGVRCVKRTVDGGVPKYVWYGEGSHGTSHYRHIGSVSWNAGFNEYRGSTVDIEGGGAVFSGFIDGWFAIAPTSSDYPSTMYASTWGETWTKSWYGSSTYGYSSPLTDILTDCGAQFRNGSSSKLQKFRAYDQLDSPTSASTGVRCALRVTAPANEWDVWYGAGSWRWRATEGVVSAPIPWSAPLAYAHVGFRGSSTTYSQYDVCNGSAFCYQRSGMPIPLALTWLDTGTGYVLNGSGLHELWLPSAAEHSTRLLAYQVSDSDGVTRKTPVSVNDILAYVTAANEIYRLHGVEVLYNRWPPTGYKDLDTIADYGLNTMELAGGGTLARKIASFYAERTPTRAVAFLTWGFSAGSCPYSGGASSLGENFVHVAALDATSIAGCGLLDQYGYGVADSAHFAHEFGHFLGLAHTFEYDDLQTYGDAQVRWISQGCAWGLFDGDELSSTGEDPNIGDYLSNLNVTLVPLLGQWGTCDPSAYSWFTLPRTNIMSYYVSNRVYDVYGGIRTGICDDTWTSTTTVGSYQNCKEITSEQASQIHNPIIQPGIEQWTSHFADFIGKSRWWRLE